MGKTLKPILKKIVHQFTENRKEYSPPTQEHFEAARASAKKLREMYGDEFILPGKNFPGLHFRADPNVAGLYRAHYNRR